MHDHPGSVAILAYSGLCVLEFGIAFEIFGLPRPELDIPWYTCQVVAVDPGPMTAMGGVQLSVDAGLESLKNARTIIIPGWRCRYEPPPEPLLQALRDAHLRGARLLSICSGAFLLAATGLLDNQTATTHWQFSNELAERFPKITVDPNVLFIDSGQLITSAGSAAGIDACLHLISRDFGMHITNTIARRLVMPPQRTGGQKQFIVSQMPKLQRTELANVLEWALEHLYESISVSQLASRMAMSERTFLRHFTDATGISPKTWLQQQRINLARDLLESTNESIVSIAQKCGYRSVESFRVAFRKTVGLPPFLYRERFGRGVIAISQ